MPPNLVVLHGEDELTISRHLSAILADSGDSPSSEVDAVRLDGRTVSMTDLETAVSTLPFFMPRRAVILFHPLARLANATNKDKFVALLDRIPPAVTLVLVEYKSLTERRAHKKNQPHWLEVWAAQAGDRVKVYHCPLPRSAEMPARIQVIVKDHQGQITLEAAKELAVLVGENPRLADQEIQKLLAYVNYSRPIQIDDVRLVTEDQAQGDVFAMVDAMGNRNAKQATKMLHRLLEQQDAGSIFGMIVRQFRLLLLAREILESRGQASQLGSIFHLPSFVTGKIFTQARHFSMEGLETIYHRLAEIDALIKTGEIDADLALDTFIAEISA
jgi:DNA polymerase-3 subunit delta